MTEQACTEAWAYSAANYKVWRHLSIIYVVRLSSGVSLDPNFQVYSTQYTDNVSIRLAVESTQVRHRRVEAYQFQETP